MTSTAVPVKDPAASMALIFDAMRHPIDPLYADVARRRGRTDGESRRSSRSLLLLVAVVLLGVLLGAGAHALRVPTAVGADRRARLIGQIESKQDANDADSRRVEDLRRDVLAEQSSALSHASRGSLKDALASAQKAAGADAVSGSGLTISLGDPPGSGAQSADGDPRTGSDSKALTSTDLQQVVNGLWAAGASAVSVNDQRITSLTAIRFAGSAVLVNYRPLTTPYTIKAIGPSSMDKRLRTGFAGHYLDTLRSSGFSVRQDASSSLTLPPVSALRLHDAQILR